MSNEENKTKSLLRFLKKLSDEHLTRFFNEVASDGYGSKFYYTLKNPRFCYQPRWDATGTTNKNYVEPDIFISSCEVDIIIEAKINNNSQDEEQLNDQLIAYYNEYAISEKNVVIIAIGGNFKNLRYHFNHNNEQVPIFKASWDGINFQYTKYNRNIRKY